MLYKKLTEEQIAQHRVDSDRRYYEKRVKRWEDGSQIDYKEYLEGTGKRQLKLTLTCEEDSVLREYCEEYNLKPQDYIRELIRSNLNIN